MYTLALLVLIGLVASSVTGFVVDNVPALERIPVLGKNLFLIASILIVWLTDVSILGSFGMGATDQWIDVVGSGIAVYSFAGITDAVVSYVQRRK